MPAILPLPGTFRRYSPYAAASETITVTTVVATATMMLFVRNTGYSVDMNSCSKFESVNVSGQNVGVDLMISSRPLNAEMVIQYSGPSTMTVSTIHATTRGTAP